MLQGNTVTVKTQIPEQFFANIQVLVQSGWYRNADELFFDAIRRLLDSRQVELQEEFMQQDVEWGLRGHD